MKRRSEAADAKEEHRRALFARVRLINDELNHLVADAAERTASVNNKASFLAVSAGVLVAASTSQLWKHVALLGVVALGLACLALACAAVAVRPGLRSGIEARRLVDRYADSGLNALQVEMQLIEDKASTLSRREVDLRGRAAWVWGGFAALAVAAASLTVVFAAQVLRG